MFVCLFFCCMNFPFWFSLMGSIWNLLLFFRCWMVWLKLYWSLLLLKREILSCSGFFSVLIYTNEPFQEHSLACLQCLWLCFLTSFLLSLFLSLSPLSLNVFIRGNPVRIKLLAHFRDANYVMFSYGFQEYALSVFHVWVYPIFPNSLSFSLPTLASMPFFPPSLHIRRHRLHGVNKVCSVNWRSKKF